MVIGLLLWLLLLGGDGVMMGVVGSTTNLVTCSLRGILASTVAFQLSGAILLANVVNKFLLMCDDRSIDVVISMVCCFVCL